LELMTLIHLNESDRHGIRSRYDNKVTRPEH
jgi:hypothetical protein